MLILWSVNNFFSLNLVYFLNSLKKFYRCTWDFMYISSSLTDKELNIHNSLCLFLSHCMSVSLSLHLSLHLFLHLSLHLSLSLIWNKLDRKYWWFKVKCVLSTNKLRFYFLKFDSIIIVYASTVSYTHLTLPTICSV
mgnify:CR=1 FL=1